MPNKQMSRNQATVLCATGPPHFGICQRDKVDNVVARQWNSAHVVPAPGNSFPARPQQHTRMQTGHTTVNQDPPPAGILWTQRSGRPPLPAEWSKVQWPTGYNIGTASDKSGRWQYITRPGGFWVTEPSPPHHRGVTSYLLFKTYLGPPEAAKPPKTCCANCVEGKPCCDSDSD